MTDKQQQVESGTDRLLRVGTLALTVLSPVINTLTARLADRLERGGKVKEALKTLDVADVETVKQPLSDALRGRGEVLVQELEDLIERGTKLSQSLAARGSEVTHDLADRGNTASQDLLKRSEEIRKELGKRGQKLNKSSQKLAKNLNKRSQKVAKDLSQRSEKITKDLSRRSEKVTKELSKRGRQATQQISEHNGTFWIISGFVVGLAAAGVTAYLLIKQRVRQQQQLEAESSFSLSQNGYLNSSISAHRDTPTRPTPSSASQQPTQPSLSDDISPTVAVVDPENRTPSAQSIPADAAFIGLVSTQRYYPVSSLTEQLTAQKTGKNNFVFFTTEEEAQQQGYLSGF